jgi:hypothetical protein
MLDKKPNAAMNRFSAFESLFVTSTILENSTLLNTGGESCTELPPESVKLDRYTKCVQLPADYSYIVKHIL